MTAQNDTTPAGPEQAVPLDAIRRRWSTYGGMGNSRGAEDYTDAGCRVFAEHGFRDVPALLGEVERLRAAVERVRALHAPWEIDDEDGHLTPVCRHCCTDPWGDQTEDCATEHDHSDGQRCDTLRALDPAGNDGPEVTR